MILEISEGIGGYIRVSGLEVGAKNKGCAIMIMAQPLFLSCLRKLQKTCCAGQAAG